MVCALRHYDVDSIDRGARLFTIRRVDEADVRFNKFATWVNGGAQFAYDVWSVAAHEIGHTIGMDEDFAGCTQCNVMWFEASTNDMSERLLGLGDAVGNNNRY